MTNKVTIPTVILDQYYYAISVLLTIVLQLICWAIAATCKFDLITDFAGSMNFVLLSVLTLILGSNYGTRGIAITVLVLVTRLYLALFLLFRVCTRKKDARFDKVRNNCVKFLVFWVFQMFWITTCCLPVVYLNSRGELGELLNLVPIGGWDYAGWITFAVGIIIQVVADYQKYQFRKNPARKELFCDYGMWHWSRHPNYFGEILIWWGAFFCVIPVIPFEKGEPSEVAAGIVTILSPLFTMLILIGGSGIPQAEGKNLKRYYDAGRGKEWEDYASQTAPLVLFPNFMYRALPPFIKRICCCELISYKYKNKNKNRNGSEYAAKYTGADDDDDNKQLEDGLVPIEMGGLTKSERNIYSDKSKGKSSYHKRDSTKLPPDWSKHKDPTGKKYYGNSVTKESSWSAPPGSTGGSSDVTVLKTTAGGNQQGSSTTTTLATNPQHQQRSTVTDGSTAGSSGAVRANRLASMNKKKTQQQQEH